jgi:hypothetical protein
VQGTASLSKDPALLAHYKEADFVVTVKLSEFWVNCPRYIPKMEKIQASRYVPREHCETPLAGWKQLDLVQDVISPVDVKKAEQAGIISIEEWMGKVMTGAPDA